MFDIYTKGFSDRLKWRLACDLINIIDPARIKELIKPEVQRAVIPFSLTGGGGGVSDIHIDDSCASNRVDTVVGHIDDSCASNRVFTIVDKACASNRVFVSGDMPTQMKSFIQKFLQERRTYIIGAAFVKGCPTLHDDTQNLAELAKLANALLRHDWGAKKGDFRWNTLQVVPAEDSVSCYDTNLIGTAVNVVVGGNDSESGLVKGIKQPTVFETAERGSITFEGGQGKIWLTRFGDDRASRQLDDFDLYEFDTLGFSTNVACMFVPLDGASNRVLPRNFIHCGCEKGELLSRPYRRDPQLTTIEVTQEQDFRSESTVKTIASKLSGPGDLFFQWSPCCGGSSWQRLNIHLAAKKGWQ